MNKLQFHPVADIFPLLAEPLLLELADDIRSHGLMSPIVLYEDKILDGRNRYLACLKAGVEPKFKKYDGNGSPLSYVISLNLHRRQLDESQRAMVGARIANLEEGRPKKTSAIALVSQPEAAKIVNVSTDSLKRARKVIESGDKELIEAVDQGKIAVSKAANVVKVRENQNVILPEKQSTFNRTTENIGWAAWSWNPVTGCNGGCSYCYAKDIAMRFTGHFKPEFHKDRLNAAANTKPISGIKGGSRVFVCSMADLFGSWVPNEWISSVIKVVESNPQWTFVFLTKNPRRYESVTFPDNAWIGATVDTQARVKDTEKYMERAVAEFKFVSCEPLLEKVEFKNPEIFDAFIIGGQSASSGAPAFQPEWKWVMTLLRQVEDLKKLLWWKDNLERPQQLP